MDHIRNLAFGLVLTPPTPADSGTLVVLESTHGLRFPTVPFKATIWPVTVMPDPHNAEIVTVTNVATDTLTIQRAQEGTTARTIVPGDQIAAAVTAAMLAEIPLTSDASVHWTGAQIVDGAVTANGGLSVPSGGLVVTGDAGVTVDLTVGENLTVVGASTVDGALSVGGSLTVTGPVLSPILQGYAEVSQAITLTSGTLSIDYRNGNHVLVTRSQPITAISVSNLPATGRVAPIMVYYTSAGAGNAVTHTINSVAVRWAFASPPTLSATGGQVDRILYTSPDNGGTWYADIIGLGY